MRHETPHSSVWRVYAAGAVLLLTLTSLSPVQSSTRRLATSQISFNYAEALQKAVYFYDTQRSGALPAYGKEPGQNRVEWRGSSGLADGAAQGVDLTGGWYDAGDHVKFGFPMASSVTLLAWGALEYRDAYSESGQLEYLKSNLAWAADYFVKAHTAPEELWGQVGKGDADHAWWGPAEVMPMERPAFKISASCPGSDLAGETAAALAATSLVFQPTDPSYAAELLSHARQLYAFADARRGRYSDCIGDAQQFYNSWSGYEDELAWGAAWLYKATGESSYLTKAAAQFEKIKGNYRWTHSWDDKSYGTFVLLSRMTGDSSYRAATERFLDYWTSGYGGERISYTPGGLAWLDTWGSLRYAANTSFLALLYSDWLRSKEGDSSKVLRYHDFAVRQMRYMLGDNPAGRSYVVGFGSNPPSQPHHRTSHGSWSNNLNEPTTQRHILYGALVGGPDSQDIYVDSRSNYITNEVALDYNAGFTGALARMVQEFGGAPLSGFPIQESRDDDELYVMASLNATGTNFTEVKALLVNKSAWPARSSKQLAMRYYFTLEPGISLSSIQLSAPYNQCLPPSAPVSAGDDQYYVEVRCDGIAIFPGGASDFRKEVQLRLTGPAGWDPTNDWSWRNLAGGAPSKTPWIVLMDGSKQVWGVAPGQESTEGCEAYEPEPVAEPTPAEPVASNDESGEAPSPDTVACEVQYDIQNDWGTGFVANVYVSNRGSSAIQGWTLTWRFAGSQKITGSWNGVVHQQGAQVSVDDADWNQELTAGSTRDFGFTAEYSDANLRPTAFELNGVGCSLAPARVAQAPAAKSAPSTTRTSTSRSTSAARTSTTAEEGPSHCGVLEEGTSTSSSGGDDGHTTVEPLPSEDSPTPPIEPEPTGCRVML